MAWAPLTICRWSMLRHLLTVLLVATALLLPFRPPSVAAAPAPIDPQQIALTPADVQPGFAVDPSVSGVTILPDSVGVSLRVDMRRPATPETLVDGPIIVQQIIVRLDAPIPAETVLSVVRDELIRDAGLTLTADGPNDGGTVSLKREEGDITLYSLGFVKENLVIFTTTGGLNTVTTFPALMELAGTSSARLDAALASTR